MARDPYPSETQDRFLLRMPDGMRDRLKAEAEANKRSMNAEIVARLEASFGGPIEAASSDFQTISWEMVRAMEEIAQKYAPALRAARAAEEERASQSQKKL